MTAPLPPQKLYLPFLTGRYTVAAGLSRLGTDHAFEFDDRRETYLTHKACVLAADPERYFCTHDFPPDLEVFAVQALAKRLEQEWPGLTTPVATFDALCRQVQDDVVVIRRDPTTGRDWNAALHLCSPNGWAAGEKVGKSFFETHVPVAEFEPINARAAQWAEMMVGARDGLQRFVWGVRTDDHLDHHPESPGEPWYPTRPRCWARVERQVILGLPEVSAAVFLIRTYLYDVRSLTPHARTALADAIDGMSEASAAYKGLAGWRGELTNWLRSPA